MTEQRKLILPGPVRKAATTNSGLIVPVGPPDSPDESLPGEKYVTLFLTWEELGGDPIDEAGIARRLSEMSAYDCLQALGRLSCMVQGGPLMSREKQLLIMRRLGWPEDLRSWIDTKLSDESDGTRVLFFPQQIVHLTRLAVLHADGRPPDDFAGGDLIGSFIECLLGVTDVFEEGDLDETDPKSVVPWILRQWAINGRQDSPLLWGRYYDVLVRTWQEVGTPEAFDAADAFQRYTGISLQEWLTTGFALYGRFLAYGVESLEDFFVEPAHWFSETAISEGVWRPFLKRNAHTLEECRAALKDEEKRYGETQYRCQVFEARPLLWYPDERLIPLALDSLERRCTEGMFFELADGAMADGLPREEFTGPFGAVFEEFVQRAWERMLPSIGVPRVHRPKAYLREGQGVDSSDAVLDAGTGVVFCEIVARRPQVATLTRGDWDAFQDDLETGPLKKARQLHLNIEDYRSGDLSFGALRYRPGQEIWPLLVMVEGFPTMPPIPSVIANEISARGWLGGLPPLAILSSEDLGHIEGLLDAGFGVLELLRLWKGNPNMAGLPFSNFLDSLQDPRIEVARQTSFYADTWDELTKSITGRLFPGALGAQD